MRHNEEQLKLSDIFHFEKNLNMGFPLFSSTVKAGFPSQADDYVEKRLDFNELLVKHSAATFCVKVSGDSMIGAGIQSGDMLVVDRSLNPKNNSIVIAIVGGELTVKRIRVVNKQLFLVPENPNYDPMPVDPETGFEVWGVVTYVLHKAD